MTSLLQALAGPEIRIALIRTDGEVFAITDNWSPEVRLGLKDLSTVLDKAADSPVVHSNGYRIYPLLAGETLVGALAGHGASPRE